MSAYQTSSAIGSEGDTASLAGYNIKSGMHHFFGSTGARIGYDRFEALMLLHAACFDSCAFAVGQAIRKGWSVSGEVHPQPHQSTANNLSWQRECVPGKI